MSPRSVDRDAKRLQILRGAIDVFARSGVDSARMADVAQAAGMGKGTLYEYFRSKDEIFVAAFEHFQEQLDRAIGKKLIGCLTPEDKLRGMVTATFGLFQSEQSFVQIMLEFWAEGIRTRHELVDLRPMYERYRAYIASFLKEGIERGAFRPVDAGTQASLIIGALDGLALQWFVDRESVCLDRAASEFCDTVLRGLAAD